MTREEKKVYEAAVAYSTSQSEATLGRLITAVMDMPMKQWPDNACPITSDKHEFGAGAATARNLKAARKAVADLLPPLVVHRGPKPEPGDAAAPDTRIDLETGERKQG